MEWLLQQLEEFKVQYNSHPDKHLKTNINLAWKKLDEYYTLLDDSPVYLASICLHPRYKTRWVKKHWAARPEWIENGITVTASPIGTTLWSEGSDHGELEDELKS